MRCRECSVWTRMKSVKDSLPCRVLSGTKSSCFLGGVSVVPLNKVSCVSALCLLPVLVLASLLDASFGLFSPFPRLPASTKPILSHLLSCSRGRSHLSYKDKLTPVCNGQDKVNLSSSFNCSLLSQSTARKQCGYVLFPHPWSHCDCLSADCSSPQSQWFSWPVDEEIAVQLFRCCLC